MKQVVVICHELFSAKYSTKTEGKVVDYRYGHFQKNLLREWGELRD
jgi:hypothetical protein